MMIMSGWSLSLRVPMVQACELWPKAVANKSCIREKRRLSMLIYKHTSGERDIFIVDN